MLLRRGNRKKSIHRTPLIWRRAPDQGSTVDFVSILSVSSQQSFSQTVSSISVSSQQSFSQSAVFQSAVFQSAVFQSFIQSVSQQSVSYVVSWLDRKCLLICVCESLSVYWEQSFLNFLCPWRTNQAKPPPALHNGQLDDTHINRLKLESRRRGGYSEVDISLGQTVR
jgi:hypothetical protein